VSVGTESWAERLPLRLRVFLFFALIAAAGAAAAGLGAWLGFRRLEAGATPEAALAVAALFGAAGTAAAALWVWGRFDAHVARPVQRLGAHLQVCARSGARGELSPETGRYLGLLAPAAAEVGEALAESRTALEARIADRTAALARQTRRMEAVLADMAEGLMVCTLTHRIALYNRKARALLGEAGEVGLDRELPGLLEAGPLEDALARLRASGDADPHEAVRLRAHCGRVLRGRLGLIHGEDGPEGYVLTLRDLDGAAAEPRAPRAPGRPEFHDLDLLTRPEAAGGAADWPLEALTFTVFDTETTGLAPADGDALVQIAALRVARGRLLEAEAFDTLVDPGRSIPAASSRIHGLTQADVAGAPAPAEAARRFHRFAGDSVLVAHNAPFDLAFLRRVPGAGVAFDHPVLDTVLLSALVFPHESDHTLDGVCARLGVETPEHLRHTALGDARMTAEALLRLLPLLARDGVGTLGAALEACRAQEALRRKQAARAGDV
jgi:DNA polymerase-3 subunit epsilon